MGYEPDVRTILKTVAPKTHDRARDWSAVQRHKTKYATEATFAEFRAWGRDCFACVQYEVAQSQGLKFLLSGVNCEARRSSVAPAEVAEFINQIEFLD